MNFVKSSTETNSVLEAPGVGAPILVTSGLTHPRLRAAMSDLVIYRGQAVLLLGDSGVGKTTVLSMLAGWLAPEAGSIQGPAARDIGVVAQQAHLLSPLSALENLLTVQRLRAKAISKTSSARAQALDLLGRLGLRDVANHLPAQLSRGQQQRVALARALLGEPLLLLADEPTANLDDAQCETMLTLMLELSKERGTGMLIATHDARVKARIKAQVQLSGNVCL